MPLLHTLAATSLALVLAAHAQTGLFTGYTVRFLGGLDHLAGLEGLNDQVRGMNAYFGVDGTWVRDAQGNLGGFEGVWAPYLNVPELTNRPDMGLALEKVLMQGERTRLLAGLEYTAGAASTSNIFLFTNGTTQSSIYAAEELEVSNMMATCRYSLKDLNLPFHAHAGLGLGLANITASGMYQQMGITFDPNAEELSEELDVQHLIQADYDGSALSARLFVGAEYELGPMSFILDLGYNHMNFGELEGSTTQVLRNATSLELEEVEVIGEPGTRYEFAPLISASLQHARDNALRIARGLPPIDGPVDLTDTSLQWGTPKAIEYDLSGGYARLGLAFRF